jgi:hypothetical protein
MRYWLTGHYRSPSLLVYLLLPMAIGSGSSVMIGGYPVAWAPTDTLRLTSAAELTTPDDAAAANEPNGAQCSGSLVDAAMCAAFMCGSDDRWPQCPSRIRSRSISRIRKGPPVKIPQGIKGRPVAARASRRLKQ